MLTEFRRMTALWTKPAGEVSLLIINPLGRRLGWKCAFQTFWENTKPNVDLFGKEILYTVVCIFSRKGGDSLWYMTEFLKMGNNSVLDFFSPSSGIQQSWDWSKSNIKKLLWGMRRGCTFIVIEIIGEGGKCCYQPLNHFSTRKRGIFKTVRQENVSNFIQCLTKYYSEATVINIQILKCKNINPKK